MIKFISVLAASFCLFAALITQNETFRAIDFALSALNFAVFLKDE